MLTARQSQACVILQRAGKNYFAHLCLFEEPECLRMPWTPKRVKLLFEQFLLHLTGNKWGLCREHQAGGSEASLYLLPYKGQIFLILWILRPRLSCKTTCRERRGVSLGPLILPRTAAGQASVIAFIFAIIIISIAGGGACVWIVGYESVRGEPQKEIYCARFDPFHP